MFLIFLADITPYITFHAKDYILKQVSIQNDKIIDIADCHLLSDSNVVIKSLIENGYIVIDSKNEFNNNILKHNIGLKPFDASQTKLISIFPDTISDLYLCINKLEDSYIYECNYNYFSVTMLSQLLKPNIRWYVPQDIFSDYIKYVFNMLYSKDNILNIFQFERILSEEKKLNLFLFNTLYEIDKPQNFSMDTIVDIPYINYNLKWRELFYKIWVFPYSLGYKQHIPSNEADPYYIVVNNILNSIIYKPKTQIDLSEFIGINI